MYAVVSIFSWITGAGPHVESQRVLHERIVPGVRQSPGFIPGYSTYDLETRQDHNMLVFENEAAARDMMASITANTAAQAGAGLRLDRISVTEVLADAHR